MIIDRIISSRLKSPRDSFEQAFLSELLISEKFRLTALAGFFSITSIWLYASPEFFSMRFPFQGVFHGIPFHKGLAGFWAIVALYEFTVSRVFALLKKNNRQPPVIALYGNAMVEAGIPTLALLIVSRNIGLNALDTPLSVVYFIFIVFSALRLNFMLSLVMGLVSGAGYLNLALFMIAENLNAGTTDLPESAYLHMSKAGLLLMGGVAAGFVGSQIRKRVVQVMKAMQERNRIEKIFGQHVSHQVVERLLCGQADMESEQRHVCVLFLDIRGFTAFAHANPPEKVVGYLNALFDTMITIVNRNHGIINKFLGDGFMAIFGAPFSEGDDCRNAVQAAIDMTTWVDQEAAVKRIPPTRTGIGIHAGDVITGHVGSNFRKEYTVIGDVVNLASRLESLNKEYGTRILVSETVWEKIRDRIHAVEEFGPVLVKGRSTPVKVYALA